MSDSESKAAAAKQRIITHMNADHADSLSHYLRHHCSLSGPAASSPHLLDISLTSMTIRAASGTSHTIPLSPPLSSWSEARQRLVVMDADARKALGIPPVRPLVEKWTPPRAPGHLVVLALVSVYAVGEMARRAGFVVPGSAAWEILQKTFPGGVGRWTWLQQKIFLPLVVIHAIETVVMVYRLKRANVPATSGVWWMWIASTAAEGVGSHQRFGALSRREAAKRLN
jgi:hypothetical protein